MSPKRLSAWRFYLCGIFLAIDSTSVFAAGNAMGEIKMLKGDVWIFRGTQQIRAKQGETLVEMDRIRCDKDSRAQLVLDGTRVLFVAAESELVIRHEQSESGKETITGVGMVYGKMRAVIGGKKTSAYKVKVHTGSTVAGVRGTHFEVMKPKGLKVASIVNLNSESDSMEVTEKFMNKGEYSKPIPVPPGSITSLAQGSPMLPPMTIPPKQLGHFLDVDSDGNRVNVTLNEKGQEVELRTDFPPGLEAYTSIIEPTFLHDGSVPPPRGYRLEKRDGKYVYTPNAERMVAADTATGGFIPVVAFGTSVSEGFVLSRLMNDSRYRSLLTESLHNQDQINRVKLGLLMSHRDKNQDAIIKLQTVLRKLEVTELKIRKEMESHRLKYQKEFRDSEIQNLILTAEKNEDRDLVKRLKAAQFTIGKHVEATQARMDSIATQMQLRMLQDQASLPFYRNQGLLAYGSGQWLGQKWEVAAGPSTSPQGNLQEKIEKLKDSLSGSQQKLEMAKNEVEKATASVLESEMGTVSQGMMTFLPPSGGDGTMNIALANQLTDTMKIAPISKEEILNLKTDIQVEKEEKKDTAKNEKPASNEPTDGKKTGGEGQEKSEGLHAMIDTAAKEEGRQSENMTQLVQLAMPEIATAMLEAPRTEQGASSDRELAQNSIAALGDLGLDQMDVNEVKEQFQQLAEEISQNCADCVADLLGPPPSDTTPDDQDSHEDTGDCPPSICQPPDPSTDDCSDPLACAPPPPPPDGPSCILNPSDPSCAGSNDICSSGCYVQCGCTQQYTNYKEVNVVVRHP